MGSTERFQKAMVVYGFVLSALNPMFNPNDTPINLDSSEVTKTQIEPIRLDNVGLIPEPSEPKKIKEIVTDLY